MKLSKSQQQVVDKMRDGWELGYSSGFFTRSWLQKNGIGKGGETINVRVNTFLLLRDKNVIEKSRSAYPTDVYRLTEQYKTKKNENDS